MYTYLFSQFMAKSVRFILASVLWTCFLCIFPTTNSHAAPGDLDTSFGTDGIVTTSISNRNDKSYGLAIQADGKILVSGGEDLSSGVGDFAVVRYIADYEDAFPWELFYPAFIKKK